MNVAKNFIDNELGTHKNYINSSFTFWLQRSVVGVQFQSTSNVITWGKFYFVGHAVVNKKQKAESSRKWYQISVWNKIENSLNLFSILNQDEYYSYLHDDTWFGVVFLVGTYPITALEFFFRTTINLVLWYQCRH